MKAQIIKIGNSRGIRIPKTLLEETGLDGAVSLRVDGRKLIISPVKKQTVQPQVNEEYRSSVGALSRDWNRVEEDDAWAYLQ